jgi:hypothetical protein
VAGTLSFMYAPHEHAEHLRHCVPSMARPRFLAVADIRGPPRRIGATRDSSVSALVHSMNLLATFRTG